MYRSFHPYDVFSEIDRLQREMQQNLNASPGIRGLARGGFPAMNVGGTAESVEIYAFMPGVDPASIEVTLENGVLTIEGERKDAMPTGDDKATVYIDERFSGRFRRVVSLPDDVDPNAVEARCRDGVLHISIKRRVLKAINNSLRLSLGVSQAHHGFWHSLLQLNYGWTS